MLHFLFDPNTGEVSAGKRSLINLILGHAVLPVGHLHTTTCVCELRFSSERSLKSFTWNTADKKLEIYQDTYIENISEMASKIQDIMRLTSKNRNHSNGAVKSSSFTGLEAHNLDAEEVAMLTTSTEDVHIEYDNFDDLKLSNGKLEIYSDFDFLKVRLI